MSIAKWSYPMNRQELYAAATLARVVNVTRGKDDPPFVADWPWPAEPDEEVVTDEERAALEATLQASSAFGQLRTGGLTDV